MNSNASAKIIAALVILILVLIGAWYHAYTNLRASRSQQVAGTLAPVAALIKENQALIAELRAAPFTEKDTTILEAYLIKIRRDGPAKNAEMKQRLDTLAENNAAAVALVKAYLPQAKMPGFVEQAEKFQNYAVTWRDRWNSVFEIFMAGGNLPVEGPEFPNRFLPAIQAELAAN
jgi:hypothetical protein